MTFISTIDLRTKLATILASIIGTYIAPDNAIDPAIYVVTNLDIDPPREWEVAGIEVLIHRNRIRNPRRVTGGVADLSRYKVELIQHDRSNSLDEAIDIILRNFPRTKIEHHYQQSEEIDEQVCLLIPCELFIA